MTKEKTGFRSAKNYGRRDRDGFIHRSWMKSEGLPADVFDGRPVIGICNTWSELTPCNAASARSGRIREAWRLGSRRTAAGIPRDVAWRDADASDRDALSQSAGDGGRRIDPRQSYRCRGAAGRLRQDHAGPIDGRRQRRSADDGRVFRADAQRQVSSGATSDPARMSGN